MNTSNVNDFVWPFSLILILLLLFVIYTEIEKSYFNQDIIEEQKEGFHNLDAIETKTNRERIIDLLNNNRKTEGALYVPCRDCNSKSKKISLLSDDDRRCRLSGIDINDITYGNVYNQCKSNDNKGMSFYNNKYVDSTKINCYGCLVSQSDKCRSKIQHYGDDRSDYLFWASLEDPVNGPPYI